MQIIIVGAGSFGLEVHGWMQMAKVEVRGFLDDEKKGVISTIKDYEPKAGDQFVVAISDSSGREMVTKLLMERKAVFHNFWLSTRSPSCKIGVGCIMCPMSLVSAYAQIGNMVHVNVFSSVGHDVVLGDYCTLSSHVDICGNVTVGERTFFGSGARVLPKVKIGSDCRIGAGAVVVQDVPDGATVYSQPARML